MPRIKASELLSYTQEVVRDIFADRLRQEGFVSPDGKDTMWYRVVNHEVVNTICFYTQWLASPVTLDIAYGIHPLFIEPFHTTKVYLPNYPINFEIFRYQTIVAKDGQGGGRYYSDDVPVYIPWGKDRGIYTLEGILLPQMNSAKTVEDCYALHKAFHLELFNNHPNLPLIEKSGAISRDFIDEGIFVEDTEFYPFFRDLITKRCRKIREFPEKRLQDNDVKQILNQYEMQKIALFENNRSVYLEHLEQRKGKVIERLKKMNVAV